MSNCATQSQEQSVDILLSRLEGVRELGNERFMACCPAHDDRNPSLSVRHAADGTVLVHCFAGCSAVEVVEAAGLRLSDLFPNDLRQTQASPRPGSYRPRAREALVALSAECSIVVAIVSDLRRGGVVSELDWKRLIQASAMIGEACRQCR